MTKSSDYERCFTTPERERIWLELKVRARPLPRETTPAWIETEHPYKVLRDKRREHILGK